MRPGAVRVFGMGRNAMDEETAARLRGAIARLSRQLNGSAAVEGLTPSQASALALIAARGPLSLADLTQIEGLNPTMVSRIVGALDRRQLIRRVPHPDDQRAAVVEATDAGRELKERIRAQRDRVVATALSGLGADDRQRIVDALPALEDLVVALGGQPLAQ